MTNSEDIAFPSSLDVRHDTFTVTRILPAPRARVFAAFRDSEIRRRWFRMPGRDATYEHEFRVGGGECATSTFSSLGSPVESLEYRSRYLDLVEDRRIVFVYESSVNETRRWVSLTSVVLDGEQETELEWTEQVVFLARTGDGSADLPHLRGATQLRLNGLAAVLLA
jgi:uncharacterized protein YndB with AHSA1/START domain